MDEIAGDTPCVKNSAEKTAEPVAWAVSDRKGRMVSVAFSLAAALSGRCEGEGVVPLYRLPTLTDAELEAVDVAAHWCETPIDPVYSQTSLAAQMAAETLRGLLQRLK